MNKQTAQLALQFMNRVNLGNGNTGQEVQAWATVVRALEEIVNTPDVTQTPKETVADAV